MCLRCKDASRELVNHVVKMRKNNSPPKQLGTLASAIDLVNEHRSKNNDLLLQECKACWDNGGHLTMELLKKFAWSGSGNKWLRNHHPFSPTFEAMAQIETAFEMLVQARASLIELYGHYHATLMYDGFEMPKEVAWKTTHEVFKYVFAAMALVQAYRRFLKLGVPDRQGYYRVFDLAFCDTELMAFVQQLRNCFGHKVFLRVSPEGKVSISDKVQVESALTFDRELLISLKDAWNSDAKRFLERSKKLNALEVIDQYHRMASELFHAYGSASGATHTVGFREVVRCTQAIASAGHVMSVGILLQGAKQRGTDPYAHLAKHFTKEEMERIQCFPSRSREQVDFMIALRDPLGFCATDLLENLYDVFGC